MDIKTLQLKFTESKEFEIINPLTHRGEGAFIEIASINSKIGKQVQLEMYRRTADARNKEEEFTEQMHKDLNREVSSKLIIGWRELTVDGEVFPYSEENSIKLVMESDLIYEMVNFNAGYTANFIKA